ncbi:dicarboxylate/amino acid:cation symporter [Brachyspira hyodysenteriae]|uniref:Sodium:proton antiporter n=1 Tax=Brachyspira hyodysenteriae ATCC 27164 TaxID=1266923 RepID=A0A3B6VT48_BRAHO|nr:cation:dicarboxylase symporter family transporter [Brachyspira hyodysenteriae]ANN64108.1 sodium:proton antiporter [Brachyspira hyodysenteriae ATCC 27164]KLI14383.1 sodium:proton antiporter [Brachyspira hyodysenteriae]KLI15222.1 sodium:proton antiporter [Brachyspira hyodysenteriae]KLI17343.1 sodium:proton antiporter [Brachyspira hyodysenteriae]KLI22372.1 sodium:proton antiporter [Brachyspira hyodysenteriae]
MKKIGLLPRIIIGIILGILVGMFLPAPVVRIFVTISSIFSLFLNFIIPLMIVAFIGYGIANLTEGATKLIGITVVISYGSTLLAGSIAFLVASNLFPTLLGASALSSVKIESGLDSYFTIPLKPLFDVTSAVVFAFILGIGITMLRPKKQGEELFSIVRDSEEVIQAILKNIIIPILPLHILGTFANLAYAGSIQHILIIFGKVFAVVITLHILYITALFIISGVIAKKSPIMLIKNQIPPYFTAVGTQSSAATIPVSLIAAERNGVSEQIRKFVIPLCATIHLAGSMITLTCCSTAVILILGQNPTYSSILPFILMLGIAMVAAPGAPGGAVMSALPFFYMIGITGEELQGLMIALYLTQDSFGTAANVSGDNAIAVFVDWFYQTRIKKDAA